MLIKTTRTAVLTVAALDLLYDQEEGCCPLCCNFCWVLKDMYRLDLLEKTILQAPERTYQDAGWWDDDQKAVKRSWLTSQWLKFDCDHGLGQETKPEPDDVEETSDQLGLDPGM